MNYRHSFHAGNFADVFKHALLARILAHLTKKDAPFRVIDTHAGEGAYDLFSTEAERTGEWREGVGRLADFAVWPEAERALLSPYVEKLGVFIEGRPRPYPGSPLLVQSFLREKDRALFSELRPDAYAALSARFKRDARVKALFLDGYTGLGAFVPPKERRGLVLIDPPFERTDEYQAKFAAFLSAYVKWPTGIYVLWHPIKYPSDTQAFYDAFAQAGVRRVLRLEICVGGDALRLNACGLVVVNPPFGFLEDARAMLELLASRLAQGEGAGFVVEELTGE
jgi:23S rRNA (adenine2030-N6)-methyltransferase